MLRRGDSNSKNKKVRRSNGHLGVPFERRNGLVKMGGEMLPAAHAAFLREYIKHRFNGSAACRALGSDPGTAGFHAWQYLRDIKIQSALRNIMEEQRARVEVTQDQVARYWLDVATADPRELSQVVYVPCRFCWGVDHQYQFTDGEYRQALQRHMRDQLQKSDPNQRVEFDELGGPGYTRNRYPMRGPDWMGKVGRICASIGKPVPEGLESNSDHSCPECHGDGDRVVWFADTRHLSPEAARLYAGVRLTKDAIEIKTRNQTEAMDKFEQLVGMIRPRRPRLDFNLDELGSDELDALLEEARNRGLLSDEEVMRGKLIDATPTSRRLEKV